MLKNSVIIGIIGIIILTVFISGCAVSNTSDKFYDGVMSFSYPDDFRNISYSNQTSPNSTIKIIGKMGNSYTLAIMVGRNISATSPEALINKSVSRSKKIPNSEMSPVYAKKNPNGILIKQIIYKHPDSTFKITLMYNDLYFKVNNSVYAISVYGPDIFNKEINNTTNIIFQTLK